MAKTVIIGGGAAGLAAACKICGDVVVLEKNDRVGKKILQTGNGRCNLSNISITSDDFMSDNGEFVKTVLGDNPYKRIKEFFADLGLLTRSENDKIYPLSNQASSVLDVLRYTAEEKGVLVKCGFCAKSIEKIKDGFYIKSNNGQKEFADKIILATGGMASPKTGSDGIGYKLAKSLGHTVITPVPALVPMKLKSDVIKSLKGIRAKAKVSLVKNGKNIANESGEIQFTDYGISGIAVMQLSRFYQDKCFITIDFLEDYSEDEIFLLLKKAREKNRKTEDLLLGIMVKRIGLAVIKSVLSNVALTDCSKKIDDNQLRMIAKATKNFEFEVLALMGFDNAQVTKGGIPLQEFDCKSMQSNKCENLYAIGEILNCDGKCGGYNLSWAWLTAMTVSDAINGE